MKYFVVEINTYYSSEDYLVPAGEEDYYDVELATDRALSNIAYCDEYKIRSWKEVDNEYLKSVEKAKEQFKELTGEPVEYAFPSGVYTTLENILYEINEIIAQNGSEK